MGKKVVNKIKLAYEKHALRHAIVTKKNAKKVLTKFVSKIKAAKLVLQKAKKTGDKKAIVKAKAAVKKIAKKTLKVSKKVKRVIKKENIKKSVDKAKIHERKIINMATKHLKHVEKALGAALKAGNAKSIAHAKATL